MTFTKRLVKSTTKPVLPSIDTIRTYLKNKGWVLTYTWQQKIEYYDHTDHKDQELKLTVSNAILKFDEKLQKFFDELAEFENKKKINLIEEMLDLQRPAKVVARIDEVKPQLEVETEGRLKNGQFTKGHEFGKLPKSINGQSICKYRGILAEDMALYLDELKAMALAPALTVPEKQLKLSAIKLIVDSVLPTLKASTYADVGVDTTKLKTLTETKEASAQMIKNLDTGMSFEDVISGLSVLQMHTKFIEMADIEPRMREIEQVIQSQRAK